MTTWPAGDQVTLLPQYTNNEGLKKTKLPPTHTHIYNTGATKTKQTLKYSFKHSEQHRWWQVEISLKQFLGFSTMQTGHSMTRTPLSSPTPSWLYSAMLASANASLDNNFPCGIRSSEWCTSLWLLLTLWMCTEEEFEHVWKLANIKGGEELAIFPEEYGEELPQAPPSDFRVSESRLSCDFVRRCVGRNLDKENGDVLFFVSDPRVAAKKPDMPFWSRFFEDVRRGGKMRSSVQQQPSNLQRCWCWHVRCYLPDLERKKKLINTQKKKGHKPTCKNISRETNKL